MHTFWLRKVWCIKMIVQCISSLLGFHLAATLTVSRTIRANLLLLEKMARFKGIWGSTCFSNRVWNKMVIRLSTCTICYLISEKRRCPSTTTHATCTESKEISTRRGLFSPICSMTRLKSSNKCSAMTSFNGTSATCASLKRSTDYLNQQFRRIARYSLTSTTICRPSQKSTLGFRSRQLENFSSYLPL